MTAALLAQDDQGPNCVSPLLIKHYHYNKKKILKLQAIYTVMHRLMTGKCVVGRFCHRANVIQCTYTNLESTIQSTTRLGYMV